MIARTVRVTVRGKVSTYCPKYDIQSQSDENQVEVSWAPKYGRHTDAEDILAVVAHFYGRKLWCEDLAAMIATGARLLVGSEVRVIVRQEVGHGVEAEAVA